MWEKLTRSPWILGMGALMDISAAILWVSQRPTISLMLVTSGTTLVLVYGIAKVGDLWVSRVIHSAIKKWWSAWLEIYHHPATRAYAVQTVLFLCALLSAGFLGVFMARVVTDSAIDLVDWIDSILPTN